MRTFFSTCLAILLIVTSLQAQGVGSSGTLPVEAARTVLAAVVRSAELKPMLKDDALTEHYFRVAAGTASKLSGKQRADAMLLALGVALDDSDLLRKNPLTRELWRQLESEEERGRRLRVLGMPTMRGRHDLAQHFTVSAALTVVGGPKLAESAGILKEQLDMRPGGSGFSFVDLTADVAGIAFANRLRQEDKLLGAAAESFRVVDHLPDLAGLREGLSQAEFQRDFGSTSDERFRKALREVWQRVDIQRRND